jgi:type III restriction enzyme
VISGDEYKTTKFGNFSDVRIFVYNAQKFNSQDENRKFNSLNENIGTSFFNYLSELDDLVVLMDESHHYRNNSTSEALDKIKPVLGLEMTATPQIVEGKKIIKFRNVVKDYPLALSIRDGYTRTPFALTRRNIESYKWGDEQLDRIMLTDGIHWHEHIKKKLAQYAEETHQKKVKPFMLVVCMNIEHAKTVLEYIKSVDCYGGAYKDKVIEVDSGKGDVEKDENVQLLLDVEKPDNPVEIVVHVNMLKEGWDVNNLYTIVPLRSAYSRTLVEQTIGRGLRLPYGKRVGDKEVDSVTMTAHANFQKVIDDAAKGNSIFNAEHVIFADDIDKPVDVHVQTSLDLHFSDADSTKRTIDNVFSGTTTERNQQTEAVVGSIIGIAKQVISDNKANGAADNAEYLKEKVKGRIISDPDISEQISAANLDNDFLIRALTCSVDDLCKVVKNNTIAIPQLVKKLSGDEEYIFDDFDLDVSQFNYGPVSQDILRQNMLDPRDKAIEAAYEIDFSKVNPARVIITILRDKAEIDYDKCSTLLVKLIGQYFDYLKKASYSDNQIRNIVDANKYQISDEIYKQMMRHYRVKSSGLVEVISNISFDIKRPVFDHPDVENALDLYTPLDSEMKIKSTVFHGGQKWLTEYYRFDSGSERDFAKACENEPKIIHWLRPAPDQFDLDYTFEGISHVYEPDFVVETKDCCYLVEVKARKDMQDPQVLAKMKRGIEYCSLATKWCLSNGYKPWEYMFVPHDAITSTTSLDNLMMFVKKA